MPFIRAGDLNVHYDLAGPAGAPVIMFANSLGTTLHLWDEQVATLGERFRLLRYDLYGHGLTTAPPRDDGKTSIAALTADAFALLDALKIDRVRFVGLSIGGMIGQHLAATAPERVERLVLCATGSAIGTADGWNTRVANVRERGIDPIADALMSVWFAPATRERRPELVEGFRTMLVRTPVDGYVACCLAVRDADLAADDAKISTPTLVVAGADDGSTPPALVAAMRARIANADYLVLDDAAHMLCAEQPAALNAALLRFLES